jgi:hypothetical protein
MTTNYQKTKNESSFKSKLNHIEKKLRKKWNAHDMVCETMVTAQTKYKKLQDELYNMQERISIIHNIIINVEDSINLLSNEKKDVMIEEIEFNKEFIIDYNYCMTDFMINDDELTIAYLNPEKYEKKNIGVTNDICLNHPTEYDKAITDCSIITGLFEDKEKNYYIDDNFNYNVKLLDSSVLTLVNKINKLSKNSSTNNKSFIEKKTLDVSRY